MGRIEVGAKARRGSPQLHVHVNGGLCRFGGIGEEALHSAEYHGARAFQQRSQGVLIASPGGQEQGIGPAGVEVTIQIGPQGRRM